MKWTRRAAGDVWEAFLGPNAVCVGTRDEQIDAIAMMIDEQVPDDVSRLPIRYDIDMGVYVVTITVEALAAAKSES